MGCKTGAALVTVKHLARVSVAKGKSVNGGSAICRCKIRAFTTGFFIGYPQEGAIVFPTTAVAGFFMVDVGIHAILQSLAKDAGMGVIIISDDLPEVIQSCSRVLVLKDGKIAADLPTEGLTDKVILDYMM